MGRKRIPGFVLGLLLISTIAFAVDSNFKPGSEPDGFRGIKWGSDISTLPDMEYVSTDTIDGYQKYKKKNDELKIGDAILKEILYSFWRGKFSSVSIFTEGGPNDMNWFNLKEAVLEKFGKERVLSSGGQVYNWFGKTTWVFLINYTPISEEGELKIFSQKIFIQKQEYDKQKAREQEERDKQKVKDGAKDGF